MQIKVWKNNFQKPDIIDLKDNLKAIYAESIRLTDINGTPIFRGDLIRVVKPSWRSVEVGAVGRVVYCPDDGRYWIQWADPYAWDTNFDGDFMKCCEVIGSIFDTINNNISFKERDNRGYERTRWI